MLTSLDAHAHFDPKRTAYELAGAGAVLAMTLSLDEARIVLDRPQPSLLRDMDGDRSRLPIAWGVGCHPRKPQAQAAFDAGLFRELVQRTAIVGEIGLDAGSRVPMERQLAVLRQALAVVAAQPRIVSIHSTQANALVLAELDRQPVAVPILHWWTGTVPETRRAVALGCYFLSIPRSPASESSAPPSRPSACSSNRTTAGPIPRPPSRVASSGWSGW